VNKYLKKIGKAIKVAVLSFFHMDYQVDEPKDEKNKKDLK